MHLVSQPVNHLPTFPFQDEQDFFHHCLVGGLVNQPGTGGQTALHLKVEAGATAITNGLAATQGKHGVEQLERCAHGRGGRVGTEIAVTVA